MCVCVCVRLRASARMSVCVCVCVCARARTRMPVSLYVWIYVIHVYHSSDKIASDWLAQNTNWLTSSQCARVCVSNNKTLLALVCGRSDGVPQNDPRGLHQHHGHPGGGSETAWSPILSTAPPPASCRTTARTFRIPQGLWHDFQGWNMNRTLLIWARFSYRSWSGSSTSLYH